MKKCTMKLAVVLVLGAMVLNSCVGSFGLTNSVLNWNKSATGNKFLNELIFLVITPAYAVCSVADALVLNSIEFWTGNKVIADAGKVKQVTGKDGRLYAVKTLKNGYEITDPDGQKTRLIYDKDNKSWNCEQDGKMVELFSFNDDGTIQACLPDGRKMNVEQNEQGLFQLRMAINDGLYFACN